VLESQGNAALTLCSEKPTRRDNPQADRFIHQFSYFLVQGKMRNGAPIAVPLLGLLVAAAAFARPQESGSNGAMGARASYNLPPDAVVDEIKFVGLHHIAAEAAKSPLSFHSGEKFDAARIAADIRALNRLGWFEDVFVKAEESDFDRGMALGAPPHFRLEFHVREYPFLTGVAFSGSRILSEQQIEKLLEDKRLSPQVGAPANPVKLHRVAIAIQAELAAMGHPQARAVIRGEKLSGQRVRVDFQIHDGPHLPVVGVRFSGHPEISDKVLRKQMRQVSPDAWFSGFRNKNVFTQNKGEEDRVNLLTYLQNHGFPQARVGTPQVTLVDTFSGGSLRWLHRQPESGLSVSLPIEAGTFYAFGRAEVSASLRHELSSAKRGDPLSSDVAPGRPFSEHAVESLRRDWEIRLHRSAQRQKGGGEYRLRATPAFDGGTHIASVRFDFDPTPPYLVRRIEFRGNQRFPDRYLRRRSGLVEGQPLDEYALEAGLARIARTGYFQPLKKEDVQIEAREAGRTADVTIHLHEKGKQRITFSGGREQFGSTVGIAYTVFNLLGLDEFLSTHIDYGPETLQLAIGLAKEGFLGSRGTLALSVFDTFVRPRFAPSVQGPFLRTQAEGANIGWTYAPSEVDAIGVNYGISRSLTEYVVNQPSSAAGLQTSVLRNKTSSHSLGIGWTHYSGEQRIQITDSVSGGWLGGNENLLKSKVEYGHIFPDQIFDHHNAWGFRTTVGAVGSYKGDTPLYARFFSGDDLVRGLRPGELGPYETLATISPSGATTYRAVPSGTDFIAASNMEYRFPLKHGVEGAAFFDGGSGLLLPNWLGQTRPSLINSTNGLFHGSTGLELRWTVPAVGAPLRINYSFNVFRLNRALFMADGSVLRLRNRLGALGWGLGTLF
jgi:outer membrane protein insertion porin family